MVLRKQVHKEVLGSEKPGNIKEFVAHTGKHFGSGIQAAESKVKKHKAVTEVQMEGQHKGETECPISNPGSVSTKSVILGKQNSLLVLCASEKTTGLSGSYMTQGPSTIPKFLRKKKLARVHWVHIL